MDERTSSVSVEKWYSVAVETVDGKSEVLRIAARNPGEVFRQAKERPGVRRVGKIAEGDLQPGRKPRPADATQHARPPADRAALIGHNLSGPRIVIDARASGEQPFKHLKPPPERPKPPTPPAPAPMPSRNAPVASAPNVQQASSARPQVSAGQASNPTPELPLTTDQPSTKPEYRIMKSRRQDGDPYVLQRGTWQQQKGKRAFAVDWEKSFVDRPTAERHLQWLEQSGREIDQLEEQSV
jgi:hypothetical protein